MKYDEWRSMNQTFEADFWGDCANTYGEETKQLMYAQGMGLDAGPWVSGVAWPSYDMEGRTVVDIGGGPTSMLLKCVNLGPSFVVDPCPYPPWVKQRYEAHGVTLLTEMAEGYTGTGFDEVWCYNVLQHVQDPDAVAHAITAAGEKVRVWEWINMPPSPGHPHEFSEFQMEGWFGVGVVRFVDDQYRYAQDGVPCWSTS